MNENYESKNENWNWKMTYSTCFPWCMQLASSSLTWILALGFSSFNESKKMFIGGGLSASSWMKMWHITMLKLASTFTMFLLVRCIFFFLDFRCYKYFLVLHFWILLWCFSLSSCITFMCSIALTSILLFSSKAFRIGENTFDTCAFDGVVDLFVGVVGVTIDGESMIFVFRRPWEDSK